MRRKPGFWVLVSLVGLLCFLGYLQYEWIDRLARAERERERQSLHLAINRISGAFDIEITRAQLAFGSGPRDPRRFDRWRGPGGGPGNGPGGPGGPGMGQGMRPDGPPMRPPMRNDGPPPPPPEDDQPIDEEAFWSERAQTWLDFAPYPRLVKEVFIRRRDRTLHVTSSGAATVTGVPEGISDPIATIPIGGPEGDEHRLIVFDGDFIRQDLLPRLVARYVDLKRYGVKVLSGDRMIFARNDFAGGESTQLFAFRPECFSSVMRRDFRRRGPPTRGDAVSIISRSNLNCDDAPKSMEPGRWTLHAGVVSSLAAGLGEFKTRSLMLSFGVLAVLGAGIGMLGFHWHRAQILAQRQMEFAMAVSHELRTPLTVIRVAADSLAEGMVRDPMKYGDLIRKETVRLSDMVEQVLVFARTQRADVKPQFEAVAADAVISRALAAVETTMERAGMEVNYEVPEDTPSVRADVNLLSAALQNLFTNAAKYAAVGKVVNVKTERADPAHVKIVVQDNGPGVRATDLPRVFSAFYRSSEAANSTIPGLGLGLHLVQRIVQAHGGSVRAANRDGGGFEVEMRIPAIES